MKPIGLNIQHNVQQIFDQLKQLDWSLTLNHLVNLQTIEVTQSIVAITRCNALLALASQYPHLSLVPTYEIDAVIHACIDHTPHPERNCFDRLEMTFQHHPGFGTNGERDRHRWLAAFKQTRTLFEHHFGLGTMGNSPPAACEIFPLKSRVE